MSKTPKRQPRKRVFKKTVEVFNKHVKRKRVTDGSDKTFELLKAKYDKEIQEKERELEVLKAKRAHLIEFADESKQLGDPNAEPPKYRGLGMTEAALDAVVCLSRTLRPGKSGVTAAEVQQYLLVHGFTATTNEFPIALAVTLKRLAESGRISSRVMLGRRLYRKRSVINPTLPRT